jgi:hypothetical protein
MTRREFCRRAFGAPTLTLLLEDPSKGIQRQGPAKFRGVNYLLRYFIRSENAQQQVDALIAYCHRNYIRHIVLFSGNNWDMGWNLPTLAEAQARVEVLMPVYQRLRQAGFHTSVNMMATIGHGDFGRDERGRFSWQLMVGNDGVESHTVPCPLDPKWKSYISDLYGNFAQLEPEIIYSRIRVVRHSHRP